MAVNDAIDCSQIVYKIFSPPDPPPRMNGGGGRLPLWQLNMNTNEISEYLSRYLICRKIFCGVYPANKIPKLRSLPALIVCNVDSNSRPEEHWIVLCVDENSRGEYFHSTGTDQMV